MKIAVVGCGALGSFYGAKLCALGEEVHFLLRSDYEQVQRCGVRVASVDGDLHVRPHCASNPAAIGRSDLVLVGLKTTANREFGRLLPPLVGPGTAVITLQNGLGSEDALAAVIDPSAVLGGLCFVCLNRTAPGVVQHTAHGNIILGEYSRPPQPRTHLFAEMFRKAGVRCEVTDNLDRAHWEKLVWNVPFNGLGVASVAGYEAVIAGQVDSHRPLGPCLTTEDLLGEERWLELVRELMHEVIAGAGRLRLHIPASAVEDRIARTRRMGAYKASTLIDYERGQPLELESMFLEPLRRARAAGAVLPRLNALSRVLASLDPASRSS
jgi:2-dehydropantoate 2-reductase